MRCHVRNCNVKVHSMQAWINHVEEQHPNLDGLVKLVCYLHMKEHSFEAPSYPVYVPYRVDEPTPYNPWVPTPPPPIWTDDKTATAKPPSAIYTDGSSNDDYDNWLSSTNFRITTPFIVQ